MADSDAEFRIRASIDTSGADAGAAQVQADLGNVAEATQATSATQQQAAAIYDEAVLNNRRNITHLLRGLLELRQGGVEAIGGIATETYVASEALGGLAGAFAPILLLMSLGIPMLTRLWGEHKGKIDEAKDSIDGEDSLKTATDNYKASLGEVAQAQKIIEDSDKAQLQAIKAQADAEKTLLDAKKNRAKADERADYLRSTEGVTDPEQLKALKQGFDARVKDIEDENNIATAQLALATKQAEVEARKKQVADARAAREQDQRLLKQAQDEGATGANWLALNGLKIDDKGTVSYGDGKDEIAGQQEKVDRAAEAIRQTKDALAHPLDHPDLNMAEVAEDLKAQEAQYAKESGLLSQLINSRNAVMAYKVAQADLGKRIESDNKVLTDATEAYNKAAGDVEPMQINLGTAQINLQSDRKESQQQYESRINEEGQAKFKKQHEEGERDAIKEGEEAKRQREEAARSAASDVGGIEGSIAGTPGVTKQAAEHVRAAARDMKDALEGHGDLVAAIMEFVQAIGKTPLATHPQVMQMVADLQAQIDHLKKP